MEVRRIFSCSTLLACFFATTLATRAQAEPPVSAELTVAIQKWRQAVTERDRYQIRGQRIVRNRVFEMERWSHIAVYYEAERLIRFDIEPFKIPQDAKSTRTNRQDGQQYRVESERAAIWTWTPDEITNYGPGTGKRLFATSDMPGMLPPPNVSTIASPRIPPAPALPETPLPWWQEILVRAGETWLARANFFATCTTSVVVLCAFGDGNKQNWNWAFASSPALRLPALFLIDTPDFEKSFDCTLSQKPTNGIRIDCVPRSRSYSDKLQGFSVILDVETGRPTAQQTIDASGNVTTIILFNEWNTGQLANIPRIERSQWDFESISLPHEITVLPHRWRK